MDELPEFLLHRIMSLLPFREAVRTSILSSKLYSAWRSFPILEFDIEARWNRMDFEPFLRVVHDSLRNRSTNSLEKLTIRANFYQRFSTLALDTIFLATSFNLRELELKNCDTMVRDSLDCRHFSVVLPGSVFLLKSLTVLKLDGFKFGTRHVVLGPFSALKKLSVSRSLGLHTLSINNNTSLEVLEIDYCEDLKLVEIDAPNLEYFEFLGPSSFHICEIRLSADCKSLSTLRLRQANFSESLLQENTSTDQVVENPFVKVSKTMILNWIRMDWANLKNLELNVMTGLENVEIPSRNLQSCVLDMGWSRACDIKFRGVGRFLRTLTLLSSEAITGSWIEQNLSQFCFLEYLTLEDCNQLQWIKFHLERFKSLKLINCYALMRMDIDAPLLDSVEMILNRKVPSYILIVSGNLRVKLSLYLPPEMEIVPYDDLKKFLVSFNNCKELTLDFKSNYYLMIPPEVRVKMIPPLYDLKHLKVDLGSERHDFYHMLNGLLWLATLPDCITFISSRGEQSIRFEYADREGEEEDRTSCCLDYPVKCWRHTEKSSID